MEKEFDTLKVITWDGPGGRAFGTKKAIRLAQDVLPAETGKATKREAVALPCLSE